MYDGILAVGLGVISYHLSKFKNMESPVFSARQVNRHDELMHGDRNTE